MRLGFLKIFGSTRHEVHVPEAVALDPELAGTRYRYKDPRVDALVKMVPLYRGVEHHAVGDLVRLRNDTLCLFEVRPNGHRGVTFLNPYVTDFDSFLAAVDARRTHQILLNAAWPTRDDPDFGTKLQALLVDLGFQPEGGDKVDPRACYKQIDVMKLKYYQRIVSTYIVYGPYRGILVNHSMGSGKTFTAIAAIENFVTFNSVERASKDVGVQVNPITLTRIRAQDDRPQVYVVLPPRASLEQNFRSEMVRAPGRIRDEILKATAGKRDTQPIVNRIINRHVTILSYVSIANRLRKGTIDLENSLVILDEAHNFLEPPPQFRTPYRYLFDRIQKTSRCKIMLMTGTPIYKSVTDLTRLLNLLRASTEPKFPETEADFFKRYLALGTAADAKPRVDSRRFIADIRGYISSYDAEGDLSLFAKRVAMLPQITHVTDEHYKKWEESRRAEAKRYGISPETRVDDLVVSKNPKFKSVTSGFYKASSAVTNVPLSYKTHGRWPKKFYALAQTLEKYPREKAFVYSRHVAQGANAIGEFLEREMGWLRMSNNRQDHGAHPPATGSPLGRLLVELESLKMTPEERLARKRALMAAHVKRPYTGFVVVNKATSQREINHAKALFNDTDLNVDGRICAAFIADESFGEGLSLLNTRHVHLLEPPYTVQAFKQIVARVVRNCSHRQLRWPWEVRIHRYIAEGDATRPMTDSYLATYAEASQAVLQQVIDCVQSASLERGLRSVRGSVQPRVSLWTRFVRLFNRRKRVVDGR